MPRGGESKFRGVSSRCFQSASRSEKGRFLGKDELKRATMVNRQKRGEKVDKKPGRGRGMGGRRSDEAIGGGRIGAM